MNKRIEELSKQAVEEMDQEAFSEDMYIPDEYLEKFAELIVKECANIANTGIDPTEDCLIGNVILKHFGIDE